MPHTKTPAWLPLLNALQRDWREAEILKDKNPDPVIEKKLREAGIWPREGAR